MKIKGFNKLIKDLKAFGDEGKERIEITTRGAAEQIAQDAKQLVKVQSSDNGTLLQSIKATPINELSYKIGTNLPYSGYIEFGTGVKVSVPAELSDVASSFRGGNKGSFKEGLEAIKEWCKRKGIPIEAAYPIFVSILNNGMTAKPFLYPSFVKGRVQYVKDLENDLNDLTNKI